MKNFIIIICFIPVCFLSNSQSIDIEGLWSVTDNIFDGTTNRLDNLYLLPENDTVTFIKSDLIVAKGKTVHDTIFLIFGFEYYDFEWIFIVNKDSLISSLPNMESSNGLSFNRINLSGTWEKIEYWWTGESYRDTCTITQDRDTIYFSELYTGVATGYLRRDSLIVIEGFEGLGIDFFTVYSNDFFSKIAPLNESVDLVTFSRFEIPSEIWNHNQDPLESGLYIYPIPTDNIINVKTDKIQIKHVKLFSLNSCLLFDNKCEDEILKLDISHLEKGLYLLDIYFLDNTTNRHLIIKN